MHVDLDNAGQAIQIISKNGKDATRDRQSLRRHVDVADDLLLLLTITGQFVMLCASGDLILMFDANVSCWLK